ncbi:hypothetical protein [Salinispora arenicola]|uniref:hypothetical protein n=1 Tax=Salinispora arenicola TaxID=168697 RepID=UPI0012BD1B7D|nr:hypothetical protein [Salinispora arenicola]NIL59389.1 hypothetical protein [Salinispora arenicola]NIL60901.1 hypothetical protein [Salinispora arenicola]
MQSEGFGARDHSRSSRSSENEEVLEAARVVLRYRRIAARRNRISLVCLCLAAGLSVYAVAVVLF